MKAFSLRVIALASIPAFGACADTGTTEPTGPGFEVTVAPLQLTNIGDACYDIDITTATGTVVSLDGICASQYGNTAGGDITYIAPCDASADADTDAGTTGVQNKVTIMPTLLDAPGGSVLTDWQNPCLPSGCQLDALCAENADTLVEFNLTIMREADQGFFDVAVNFADIFCSAKVDCQYSTGDYIRLVHGDNGQRTLTAVAAFACTDGNFGGNTTQLYASNVTVNCNGGTTTVDTSTAGNVYSSNPSGVVEQAIVFMGTEDLQVGELDAGKVYWNTAIGFDEAGSSTETAPVLTDANCTLTFTATASQGALDLSSNGYLSHPFLVASVPLTGESGALLCAQHPLNSGAFTTVYDDAFPTSIAWTLNGTQADAGEAVSTTPAP